MSNRTRPVVVDGGKHQSKSIKRLRRGEGKLLDEVHEIVELTRREMGAEATGKVLVPVVMIYKKERKVRASNLSGLGC